MLLNSDEKFPRWKIVSIRMTNHYRTWGRKLRLVGKNRDKLSSDAPSQDDEPDEGSDQANARPRYFFFWDRLKSHMYETSVISAEDHMKRITVASADIVTTPDLFKCVRQFFVRRCLL
ncbi:hypothetical protein TNCV_617521 [Trichonephila clavipes]|nr:hypothetical protein TNCV_617521 [Trichonephila clavipes]